MGRIWEAAVVGGGPAGLAAGLYLARAGRRAVLLEKEALGGQARRLGRIENYPGFPAGISGRRLMGLFARQARVHGLVTLRAEVRSVRRQGKYFLLRTDLGPVRSRCVVLCPGADFRDLGVPGERRLRGRGVFHGAWDGAAGFRGRRVAVAGGGEAVHQALALAPHAAKVFIICRKARLRAIPLLLRRLARQPNVEVILHAAVERIEAARSLRAVAVRDLKTRRRRRLRVEALLVLVGKRVARLWARRRTGRGLFLAGDVRNGPFRQVAIAAGDGIRAAMRCERHLQATP